MANQLGTNKVTGNPGKHWIFVVRGGVIIVHDTYDCELTSDIEKTNSHTLTSGWR